MNEKLAQGLSPRTVRRIRATLRASLSQAVRDGIVQRNVAALAEPPSVDDRRPEPMTAAQAKSILRAVEGHRLEPLFRVALGTGMRQGEILGLQWSDVDLEDGAITVRRALQRIDGSPQLVEPKSLKARRTIPLPEMAKAALETQLEQQKLERIHEPAWSDSNFVFTTTKGTPLDGRNVTKCFQRLLAEAGLPGMRFHDLRHGFATLMLAEGMNPRIVQDFLGHSQIGLTLGTYTQVPDALLREAAQSLDNAVSRPETARQGTR